MENETQAAARTCPFYTPETGGSASGGHLASHGDPRRCREVKCAVWSGDEEGRCAFVAIAEALTKPAPAEL
jgi:hypothetical protein